VGLKLRLPLSSDGALLRRNGIVESSRPLRLNRELHEKKKPDRRSLARVACAIRGSTGSHYLSTAEEIQSGHFRVCPWVSVITDHFQMFDWPRSSSHQPQLWHSPNDFWLGTRSSREVPPAETIPALRCHLA